MYNLWQPVADKMSLQLQDQVTVSLDLLIYDYLSATMHRRQEHAVISVRQSLYILHVIFLVKKNRLQLCAKWIFPVFQFKTLKNVKKQKLPKTGKKRLKI